MSESLRRAYLAGEYSVESDYLKIALDIVGDEKRSRKENDNEDSDYLGRTPHFVKDDD